LKMVYDMLVDDGYLCILSDNSGVIFTLRFFNEGLITLNIEYFKKESEPSKISFEVGVKFRFLFFTTFHIPRRFSKTSNWFRFRSFRALISCD
jgi:hypothetical protein